MSRLGTNFPWRWQELVHTQVVETGRKGSKGTVQYRVKVTQNGHAKD